MKKALILLTSAIAMMAIAAAPGCSGGGDDDDDDDGGSGLHTGTYAVSGAAVTDGCGFYGTDSYYAGVTEADVTVTATTVDVSGFPDDLSYDLSGTTLQDNQFGGTTNFDFTDNASADYPLSSGNEYACVGVYDVNYHGTVTGTDAFTLEDEYSLTVTSGNECSIALGSAFQAAITALPCSSLDSVDLAL